MLPHDVGLLNQTMEEFHSSKIGGHSGINRTTARIGAQFYWNGMRSDISKFVRECAICQQAKVELYCSIASFTRIYNHFYSS